MRGTWWKQTARERGSYRDTVNLFFGALIGANLGTLGELAVGDYVRVIAVLLGVIMAVQAASAARSRAYWAGTLVAFGGLAVIAFWTDALQPAGLSRNDFTKILATVGMWIVATLAIELTPVIGPAASEPPAA